MDKLENLKSTIKYPTSLIVGGVDVIGIELAKALLEQGGYVIMVDNVDDNFLDVVDELKEYKLFAYYDYSQLLRFEDYLRRLDYVFYLSHNINSLETEVSSQDFLEFSKYLDQVLLLSTRYNSKFLGSTSISAHQNLVESKMHSMELGESDRIHTVYNQAEIQRYTESLALEYHNKSQLNVRIVRLGNIIGGDSYLSSNSKLGRLINEALFEDEIKVRGDGLDSDYYIDVKDGVYGIIKAQFSKDTNGEIFSIAYENEISILSIVYKLNELIEHPKEIIFAEGESNYRAFRLYKPAPNLMRVGWSPRVSFERALKQTIEDFKARKELEIISSEEQDVDEETSIEEPVNKSGLGGFLSWFFFKSEVKKGSNVPHEPDGALAHLIQERKRSSETRKGSILMATKRMDNENSKNMRPRSSRFKGKLMRSFDNLISPFESLRYITIRQFIFLIILSVILVVFYFNIFVVLVDSIKQIVNVSNSERKIATQIQQVKNYTYNYSDDFRQVSESADSINSNLDTYAFLKGTGPYDGLKTKFAEVSNAMRQIYSGTKDLDFTLDQTKQYLEAYNENIVYKQYNQSIIGIENDELIIKEYDNYNPSYQISEDGLKNIAGGVKSLENLDFSSLNGNLQGFVNQFLGNTRKVQNIYSSLNKIDKFLPALTGEAGEKSFVLILVDNTIYTPAGGYPVAELYLTYEKGKLKEISLINSVDTIKFTNIDPIALQQLNLVRNASVTNNEVTYLDIFSLSQGNIYLQSLKDFFLETNRLEKVDGIVVVNLEFLADLLNIQEPIEVEGINFTKETLLNNINQLTVQNDNSLEFRKELLTNILGLSVQNILNKLDSNIFELTGIIEQNLNEKNISYMFSDDLFGSYLKIDNVSDDNVQNLMDYISISAIGEKSELKYANSKIELKAEIDISVSEEGNVRKTVELENENNQLISAILVCMPAGTSNFEFLESTSLATDIRVNVFETCLRLKPINGGNYKFSYNSPSIQFTENNVWDYVFGIRKQPGTDLNLDLELNSTSRVIISADQAEIRDKNRAGRNGELESDTAIKVNFE
jgi:nucleoside-diphosphate-sugar epimerase